MVPTLRCSLPMGCSLVVRRAGAGTGGKRGRKNSAPSKRVASRGHGRAGLGSSGHGESFAREDEEDADAEENETMREGRRGARGLTGGARGFSASIRQIFQLF